jgi:hypothetical protein
VKRPDKMLEVASTLCSSWLHFRKRMERKLQYIKLFRHVAQCMVARTILTMSLTLETRSCSVEIDTSTLTA